MNSVRLGVFNKMAVINMLFFTVIFSHFTKTEKPEIKTKLSELICENDGCEKKDNHVFLKNFSFQENEFSVKTNEQGEESERIAFFTDHVRSDMHPENGDKLVENDSKLHSPIVQMTEPNSNSNNSRDSYLTGSVKDFETNDISPMDTDVKSGVIRNEEHSELSGSNSSENTSSSSSHLDNSVEITTEIASPSKKNFTHAQSNSTNLFPVQNENSPKKILKNNTAVCICNLKVDECDINCCCDEDCTLSMKQVFSHCADLKDVSAVWTRNHCLNFKSIFKNNAMDMEMSHGDGLLCIVKNNLKINAPFNVGQIIQNTTNFQKRITGRKFYKYSEVHAVEPKMSNSSYQMGDYLWAVANKELVPFGVPHYHVNKQCDHVQNMRFLTEYSTECLYRVPWNRNSCEKASQLEMKFFLKNARIIKSPSFVVKNQNSSDVCVNDICAEISTYTCAESLKISSCTETSPRRLLWDKDFCKNIVSSVEYHFFHNGTEGITEVKAYFTLANLSSTTDSYFLQKIKLKYFWAEMPVQAFIRSGNPGYVIGKPIMAGKKIFNDNETSTLKKEAIDLSGNPENWLSVAGSKKGICTFDKRDALNFGENLIHGCLISLKEYDLTKRKCLDLQEIIFKFLIGDEYANIKTNNKFNKYVATFGNSRVEETGDWVQVIIDTLPIVSSQPSVTVLNDVIVCKNIVTELFINVAHSKIGSFKNPQNKILGVQFYFGSSKNIIYTDYKNPDAKANGMVKISTFVHFSDLSTRPQAEFAETPGFEAKFPHDFFYPFFSAGSRLVHQNTLIAFFLVVSRFFF